MPLELTQHPRSPKLKIPKSQSLNPSALQPSTNPPSDDLQNLRLGVQVSLLHRCTVITMASSNLHSTKIYTEKKKTWKKQLFWTVWRGKSCWNIEGPPIRQFSLRVGTVAMNNPFASARMNWKWLKYQIRQIRGSTLLQFYINYYKLDLPPTH